MRRMLLVALLGLCVSPVMALDVCKSTISQSATPEFNAQTTSSTYAFTLYKDRQVVTSVSVITTPERATPVQVGREEAYVEKIRNGKMVIGTANEGFNLVMATDAPTGADQRVNYHLNLTSLTGMNPVKKGPGAGIERPTGTTLNYCGTSSLAVGDKELQAIPDSALVLEVARVN